MRSRPAPLARRTEGRYFVVSLEDGEEIGFRSPRESTRLSLVATLTRNGIERDGDDIKVTTEMEEVLGAALGLFWRHSSKDLDANRYDFPAGDAGLRAYGNAVLEELDEAGYTAARLEPVYAVLGTRLMSNLLPSAPEVVQRMDFSVSPPVNGTSSSLTSG